MLDQDENATSGISVAVTHRCNTRCWRSGINRASNHLHDGLVDQTQRLLPSFAVIIEVLQVVVCSPVPLHRVQSAGSGATVPINQVLEPADLPGRTNTLQCLRESTELCVDHAFNIQGTHKVSDDVRTY